MTSPTDRIRNLVSAGKVSPEEGARLVRALAPSTATRSAWWSLINPFDRFGGETAALAGAVVSALGLFVAHFGCRFNGFLDVHGGPGVQVTTTTALLDQLVSWVLPSLLFWGYARIASGHVRLVDFVGFVGVARATLLVDGALDVGLAPRVELGSIPQITPQLVLLICLTLPLVGWFFTLLYQGFKNASGLTGVKLVGGFIGVCVVAEAVSKLVLLLPH